MFATEKDIPNLNYNYNNFHFSISEKENESEFDIKLKQAWEKAQKDGIFRYVLNISSWRVLEGPYRLLAQVYIYIYSSISENHYLYFLFIMHSKIY